MTNLFETTFAQFFPKWAPQTHRGNDRANTAERMVYCQSGSEPCHQSVKGLLCHWCLMGGAK